MKFRHVGVASTAAIIMLAAGCSSGSGGNTPRLNIEKTNIVVDAFLSRTCFPIFELARQLLRRREPNCLQPQRRGR
jgi:hypothetical protein